MSAGKRGRDGAIEQPASARDALIAEIIGDVSTLLDKLDGVVPELVRAHQDVQLARHQLSQEAEGFRTGIVLALSNVQATATTALIRGAKLAAADSFGQQRRAMSEAAVQLFKSELDPTLQKLVTPLRELVEELDRPWQSWLTHLATALASCCLTLAFSVPLLCR